MRTSPLYKRYAVVLFIPILIMMGITGSLQWIMADSLAGLTIMIDPGHGGIDPGANLPGIKEKDVNLAVALKISEALRGYGANVILTRETDTDLSDRCSNERVKGRHRRDLAARIEFIDEVNAQIFISIHTNANPNTERRGAQTFYWHASEQGEALAQAIHSELQTKVISDTKANPGNYFLLKRSTIPAALVEIGYITHPEERQALLSEEHQRRVAEAVSQGIKKFVSGIY